MQRSSDGRSRGWLPAFIAGLLAMAAMIGLQEALNGYSQSIPSAARAAAQWVVRLTPGPVTTAMIGTLGHNAISLLTISVYIGTAVIGGLIAVEAGRQLAADRGRLAIGLLILVPLLLYLLVSPIQVRQASDYPLVLVVGLIGGLIFAGLTLAIWRGLHPKTLPASAPPFLATVDRRVVMGGSLGIVALLAGGGTGLSQRIRQASQIDEDLQPISPPPATVAPAVKAGSPPTVALTAAAASSAPSQSAGEATRPASPATAAVPPTAAPPTPTAGPSPEELEERYFAAIKGMPAEVTPIEKFYTVDEAIDDPRVDGRTWRLTIKGLVEKPLTLTYEELRARPAVDLHATLMCINYEPDEDLISNAKWRGVRLVELLKEAGLKSGVTHLILRSVDGYDESHRLERAQDPGTLLAYGMNDKVLPIDHGYPVRAVIPGLYGYKNVKWLTEIEAVDKPHQGYWQKAAGRNIEAPYQGAISRIDTIDSLPVKVGGDAKIGGIAFAGPQGISKVEVSDDDGQSWQVARLKKLLSPYSWRLWAVDWKPKKAGKIKLLVRAFEGDGKPQVATVKAPHPDGATGLHVLDVEVQP